MLKCSRCGTEYEAYNNDSWRICRPCRRKHSQEYLKKNKDAIKRRKEHNKRVTSAIFSKLGIDSLDEDGKKQIKEQGLQ